MTRKRQVLGRAQGQAPAVASGLSPLANDQQYRITQAQAEKFERALRELAPRPTDAETDPRWRRIEEAALRGQLNDLRAQLAEYEARSVGQPTLR
jgi:hypothetical protein